MVRSFSRRVVIQVVIGWSENKLFIDMFGRHYHHYTLQHHDHHRHHHYHHHNHYRHGYVNVCSVQLSDET